jgi:DMSO/TMAO reductase YedYZ molybdopterin-dependent catalytic subunit
MKRPKIDPVGLYGKIPLAPHQLTEDLTPREDVIVLCHLGVAHVVAETWELEIDGLVSTPRRLSLADLQRFPQHTVTSIHQCAGSPLAPQEPKRRIVNVRWSGVRVIDVLKDSGVLPQAQYLWSHGADYGEFAGVAVDRYTKDLPLARLSSDVLIATALNGEPLRPENGFPARLVVPGFYGTNSVKWLTRMTLADSRADGPFTTRWYNDAVLDDQGRDTGRTAPVWAIAPESVIVSPAPEQTLRAGEACLIWGRAWSDGGVGSVKVSVDGGQTWKTADLESAVERSWQRFSLSWTPDRTGPVTLSSLARDRQGREQPRAGSRNAVHSVSVTIV